MNAKYRLKKSSQFNRVYKKGASVADKNLVLLYLQTEKGGCVRVGFPVSKKYGKAVKRNKLRRLLKACAQKLLTNVKEGYLLIVLPRENCPRDYKTLYNSFCALLTKARLTTAL